MDHSDESLSNLSSSPDSLSAVTDNGDVADGNATTAGTDAVRRRPPSLVEINNLYSALQDLVKSPRKSDRRRGNSTVSISSTISSSSTESYDYHRGDTRSLPRSASLSRSQKEQQGPRANKDAASRESSQRGSPKYSLNRRSPSAVSIETNQRRTSDGTRSPVGRNRQQRASSTQSRSAGVPSSSRDMSRIMALNLASSVSPKLKRRLASKVGLLGQAVEVEKSRSRSCSMPGRPSDPATSSINQAKASPSTTKAASSSGPVRSSIPKQKMSLDSRSSSFDVVEEGVVSSDDYSPRPSSNLRKTKTLPRGAHIARPIMKSQDLEQTQKEISSRIQSWYKTAAALALTQEIEEIKLASDFPGVMSHLSTTGNTESTDSHEKFQEGDDKTKEHERKVSLGSESGRLPRQPLFYTPDAAKTATAGDHRATDEPNNLTMIIQYAADDKETTSNRQRHRPSNVLLLRQGRTSWSHPQDSLFFTNKDDHSARSYEHNNNNCSIDKSNGAARSKSFNYADWERRHRSKMMNGKATEPRPRTVYAIGTYYNDRVYEIDVLDARDTIEARSGSLDSADDHTDEERATEAHDGSQCSSIVVPMGVKRCKGHHHDDKNFWGRFRSLSKRKSKAGQLAKLKNKFMSSKA